MRSSNFTHSLAFQHLEDVGEIDTEGGDLVEDLLRAPPRPLIGGVDPAVVGEGVHRLARHRVHRVLGATSSLTAMPMVIKKSPISTSRKGLMSTSS